MAKIILDEVGIKKVRQLRQNGDLDQAERMLLNAEPSPAVADELRKTESEKAKIAKKARNWRKVIQYLEFYNTYAKRVLPYCMKTANQEPPQHSPTDQKLLEEAKIRLNIK